MTQIETETYILPAYWASALINNDWSGMDDQEEQELNNWLEQVKPGSCVGCSDYGYFSYRNDAGMLAGDVLEFYFRRV